MRYPEWENLQQTRDPDNPFSALFHYEDGASFYVEPAFYTQLKNLEIREPDRYQDILQEMARLVHKNRRIIFTAEYESPLTKKEHYLYLEIVDVTDAIRLFTQDKNRGSDYGD